MTSSRRAGYEELDAKRESYENELEWLEQQDKENIEAGRAIQVRLRLVSLSCFFRHADAVSGDRSGVLALCSPSRRRAASRRWRIRRSSFTSSRASSRRCDVDPL